MRTCTNIQALHVARKCDPVSSVQSFQNYNTGFILLHKFLPKGTISIEYYKNMLTRGQIVQLPMILFSPEFVYSFLKDLWSIYKSRSQQLIVYKVNEVTVTYSEKMRGFRMDVVKINAHDHNIGVSAEYEWMKQSYPKHKVLRQSITTLGAIRGEDLKDNDIPFDVILIELQGGRHKQVFFDIADFFPVGLVPPSNPGLYAIRKLSELYGK